MAYGRPEGSYGEGGFLALAATVLCCYEHLITFDEEVHCIWRRRISAATILFVVNRYAILALSAASIIGIIPWKSQPEAYFSQQRICSMVIILVDVGFVLVNLAYAVFAALRMFALYDMSKPIFALVLAVGLMNPCTQIFLIHMATIGATGGFQPAGNPAFLLMGRFNCYHLAKNRVLFHVLGPQVPLEYIIPALRIHGLVFEILLIGLTWKKTKTRCSLQDTVMRTPFTTILLRNGTMYFLAIAAASTFNLVGMIVLIVSPPNPTLPNNGFNALLAIAEAGQIVDTIISLCMSRFILNLLAVSLDEGSSQLRSSQWNTLRFATVAESITGTFGRDLPDVASDDEPMDGEESWRSEVIHIAAEMLVSSSEAESSYEP